jgi:hypothetical protein
VTEAMTAAIRSEPGSVGRVRLVLALLGGLLGALVAVDFVILSVRSPYPEIVTAAVGASVLTAILEWRAKRGTLPAPAVTVPVIALISFFSAFVAVGVCVDVAIGIQRWGLG